MTERQEFKVIRAYDDFELREYLPCVLAEVKISAKSSNPTSGAFSSLFNYISQGHKSSEKIAMTAPVITAQNAVKAESDEWLVSFVMPSGATIGHLPEPNNSQVKLRELDTEICVAKSFRGRASDDLAKKVTEELRRSAAQASISLSNEVRICRFDPPFKPGFFQYNEIVIPILSDAV